jgi:hypothetical protein
MEQGSKRPDAPKLAQATVRAAVAKASHLVPKRVLIAGGKSFGGRMTSQAQAALPLPGVCARLPGFSTSSRGTAIGRACNPPVRGENPDAVFARNA